MTSDQPLPAIQFTAQDIDAFARLSGDYNPVHVDPVQARRLLYGQPVCHGVLTLLWALSVMTPVEMPDLEQDETQFFINRLKVEFKQPVFISDMIEAAWTANGDRRVCRVRKDGKLVTKIEVVGEWRLPDDPGVVDLVDLGASGADQTGASPNAHLPKVLGRDEIIGAQGSVPVGVSAMDRDQAGCKAFLPGRIPAGQVSTIAASSRIVGMECPGLHSLFASLELEFSDGASQRDPLSYNCTDFDTRFALAELDIAGAARGSIRAFLRPEPVSQRSFAEIEALVDHRHFEGAHALVIGGSRGVGEVVAKSVAAMGGKVTITYQAGKDDAARICQDINARYSGRANAVHFDVADPVLDGAETEFPFTHLFFAASPKIAPSEKGAVFSDPAYQGFAAIYVDGLRRSLAAVSSRLGPDACLVNLSTEYIDRPVEGFAEYAKAKQASEAECSAFAQSMGMRAVNWRLPKMATDQTQALYKEPAPDPVPILIDRLTALT